MCAPQAVMLEASSPEAPLTFKEAQGVPRRVLLVEENDFVAGVVTCLLHRRQLEVLRARDGEQGAHLFRQHASEMALLIVDCRLRDMDGLTVVRSLRRICPGLPVLLTSANNYAGPRSLADGPTVFLAKPFLPAEFLRQIDVLMGAIA